MTFLSFFPQFTHTREHIFFALLLISVTAATIKGKSLWVRTPLDLPLFLFLSWVLASVPFAIDPSYSFSEWRKLAVQALTFYWVALVLRMSPNHSGYKWTFGAILLGTVVLDIYAMTDFIQHGGSLWDRYVRAKAPSSSATWLSAYLIVVIPIVASIGIRTMIPLLRSFCIATLGLSFVTLGLSYMRTGWVSLFVQVLSLGFWKKRRMVIGTVAALLVILGSGVWTLHEFGAQRATLDPSNLIIRAAAWKLGLQELISHPVVGIGYGNDTFTKRFEGTEEYQKEFGNNPETLHTVGPHSLFVMVALGSGVPALLLLVWLFARAVTVLSKHDIREVPELEPIKIGTALMVIGFAVTSCFESLLAGGLSQLFWTILATGLLAERYDSVLWRMEPERNIETAPHLYPHTSAKSQESGL